MSDQTTASSWLTRFLAELGLTTLFASPTDVKLLCLQRFVRLFAYGASTLILASYLSEVGTSDEKIGLFMTLTLAGDVGISFILALVADGLGRRNVLALGAALMTASGVVFGLTGNYWGLLAAAIFGVITPSGNEIGPFRAVEESTIAHLTPSERRADVFAWYTLIGSAGVALGLISSGWLTTLLTEKKGWTTVEAYRLIFFGYAGVGLIKLTLAICLSERCEAEKQPPTANSTETAPLLADAASKPKKPTAFALLPNLSKESRLILAQLCLLFAFDNFASGLAPMSWITYYFHTRFALPSGKLGTLFFTTALISAASILLATSLSRRIGNIRTMVFTHLPSSICLALIGIPCSLPVAITLLVLRACTQSMDSAPRSAFLAAVVLPNERTAFMGMINLVKTCSQSLGPLVTGVLVGKKLFWVAFLAAGCLKATYDIGMLMVFLGYKTREDRAIERQREVESEQ